MVEVEVALITVDTRVNMPIVLLKEKEGSPKRVLPIWIGQAEATAIQLKLKNAPSTPRPMTHDLMKNLIESLDARVDSIFVHSVIASEGEGGTYLGQINLEVDGKKIEVDSRPSDAIALALRLEAPIHVADQILEDNGFSEDEIKDSGKEAAKSALENLDEDTLGRYSV